ncbi:MAG TPA: sigma-70 family RNA polymerase sigma factor [Candidatus Polarisedimenticolia bacterium]|nr:sigma-70 family RNA polymerase sigma factor [Candidatus Polarisedimenticolia bacterium]
MKKAGRSSHRTTLGRYLAAIRPIPLLPRGKEADLAGRISRGSRHAANRLAASNLRFVVKIAREYQGMGIELEDLISEGNVGLLRAASRYDPSRGTRFITYAAWWVRKAILSALSDQSVVHVPDSRRRKEAEQGLVTRYIAIPLDDRDDVPGLFPTGALEDPDAVDPEAETIRRQALARMSRSLSCLRRVERRILTERFGLDGAGERTLREVGKGLGLSRERVRQIQDQAMERLRRRLAERAGQE